MVMWCWVVHGGSSLISLGAVWLWLRLLLLLSQLLVQDMCSPGQQAISVGIRSGELCDSSNGREIFPRPMEKENWRQRGIEHAFSLFFLSSFSYRFPDQSTLPPWCVCFFPSSFEDREWGVPVPVFLLLCGSLRPSEGGRNRKRTGKMRKLRKVGKCIFLSFSLFISLLFTKLLVTLRGKIHQRKQQARFLCPSLPFLHVQVIASLTLHTFPHLSLLFLLSALSSRIYGSDTPTRSHERNQQKKAT